MARRSAQTALWHITQSLVRLMAPVLSFTAEEAWPLGDPKTHAAEGETVFTQVCHRFPDIDEGQALIEKLPPITASRGEGAATINSVRPDLPIGSSPTAALSSTASGAK